MSMPSLLPPDGTGRRDPGTLDGGFFSIARSSMSSGTKPAFDRLNCLIYFEAMDAKRHLPGINDAGQVVGETSTAEGDAHAFITGPDGMGMRDLGTLGGRESRAYDINDAGQVVGVSATEGLEPTHAFITGPDGMGMRDLGTLGGQYSYANGVNDAGQVVGQAYTAEGNPHAFITGPDGEGMVDLNSLVDLPDGVILTQAGGINNNGQVIAMGMEVMGVIPEPEAYALMLAGLGLIGLMGGARRRRTRTREPGERLDQS